MTPHDFPPTRAAALARIDALDPAAYARSRNALGGAVSRLSPYITHGLVDPREVLARLHARQPLHAEHRFVQELGWRAFFHHVWAHRGDGILASLHPGPLPDSAYATEVPADVRAACTGVPVVDQAVRTLYATGWLHNHARMWLASYLVHLRKVHWRAGADWLIGHLLDGDLASNHLSWQWIAGTGSHRPYLFNAENVARYAPPDWHSPGTVVDTSYERLAEIAHDPRPPSPADAPPSRRIPARAAGPVTLPLFDDDPPTPAPPPAAAVQEPPRLAAPPGPLATTTPDAAAVAGRPVWLVHPWHLADLPGDLPPDTVVLGLLVAEVHRAWPWTARRWQFVGTRLQALAPVVWWGEAGAIGTALAAARSVQAVAHPQLAPWLARWAVTRPAPALFPDVPTPCRSFSQWWRQASKRVRSVDDWLGPATGG